MSFVKRAAALLCTAVLMFAVSACGNDPQDATLYFELSERPATLDAQVASSDSEIVIVNGIYEGLLRHNESGAVVCAACERYSLDGLVYTFHLKNDLYWSNGTPVTADDFVFAFERAVSPETAAPFVSRLFSIVGAKEAYEGGGLDGFGVEATDEHTLKITLKKADPDFDETLTSPVCMPCNRAFFEECAGKYGLSPDCVITNGPYTVTKWNTEDFGIRIYKSDIYAGDFSACNAAVFFSASEDESAVERLKGNKVDMAFLPDCDYDEAKSSSINVLTSQSSMLVLHINDRYSPAIKESFARLTSGKIYSSSLKGSYTVANSIYPKVLKVKNCENIGFTVYDIETAQNLFAAAVTTLPDKKFPSATLYYYNDPCIKDIATAIVSHWQQKISAFVNIKAVDDIELLKKTVYDESEMDFALFPVNAVSSSRKEYLKQLGVEYENEDPAFIQEGLLSDDTVIPIAFCGKHIAYTKSIDRVYGKPESAQIDFCYITKTE